MFPLKNSWKNQTFLNEFLVKTLLGRWSSPVMISPLQGEDPRFESASAQSFLQKKARKELLTPFEKYFLLAT